MILNFLAVFIGGGIGASLRYMIGVLCSRYISCSFPVATFGVNLISCFVIGFLLAFFFNRPFFNPAWKLAATVGFCGGLSTVSTFSVESLQLIKAGNYFLAILYIVLTGVICIISTFLGFKLGNRIFFGI